MDKYKKAFLAAFPLTLPICAAFLFLGFSYGFFICSKGFSPWYPFFTSMLVFAGSMEFVLVGMLLSAFNPWYCYLMTLMVNSRHLFYGLSMLEKFKDKRDILEDLFDNVKYSNLVDSKNWEK